MLLSKCLLPFPRWAIAPGVWGRSPIVIKGGREKPDLRLRLWFCVVRLKYSGQIKTHKGSIVRGNILRLFDK